MKLNPRDVDFFQEIFEECSGSCLTPLRRVAGPSWRMETPIVRGIQEGLEPSSLSVSSSAECYGNWFWTAGVGLLAVFPRESGRYLCEEWFKQLRNKTALIGLDAHAVAEAANILVNRFSGPLAEILDLELIISAPESAMGSLDDLLSRGLAKHPGLDVISLLCSATFRSSGHPFEFAILTLLDRESVEYMRSRVPA